MVGQAFQGYQKPTNERRARSDRNHRGQLSARRMDTVNVPPVYVRVYGVAQKNVTIKRSRHRCLDPVQRQLSDKGRRRKRHELDRQNRRR